MKKILKIIIVLLTLLISSYVYADTDDSKLVKNRYDNIYAVYDGPDRVHLYYAQRYTLNDITAYCIEPGIGIDTDTYSSTDDWSITNLSPNIRNYIRLIAYYGYDYPGHDTMKYYLATQELIWRHIEGREIYWVEGEDKNGPKIDLTKEKETIEQLAKNHTKLPSFDNQTIEIPLGKTITIEDTNKVLSEYEIYSSSTKDIIIDGNNLKITAKEVTDNSEIRLIRKHYTTNIALIYHSGNNQKLIRSGILDPVISSSKVNINIKAKVKVIKTDKQYKFTIKQSGIKFKIKNLDTNKYICNNDDCFYKTNNLGFFITDLLDSGNYQLEEIENQNFYDYTWNNAPLKFSIDSNSNFKYEDDEPIIEIKFQNKQVNGQVILKKLGEVPIIKDGQISYEYIPLNNVKFKLYVAEDIYNGIGTLVKKKGYVERIFDTVNGRFDVDGLYLGKYCLEEMTTQEKYILDDKPYCFNLEYKDKYTEHISTTITIKNNLKKGHFELIKKDGLTNNPISNTEISLYTEKDELIYTGLTDEKGYIYIKNIPLGKYYYIETKAPTGYILDTKKHYFEINENGKTISEVLINEPISATFEFLKIDYENNSPLPDTVIEIYNEFDELLYTQKTNEEGKIIIEKIPYGKYYFIEAKAPTGYILDTEKHYFEINENNVIIKANMTNIRIPVPDTYLNENNIIYIISILSIILSLILFKIKKHYLKIIGFLILLLALFIPIYNEHKKVYYQKVSRIEAINYINNTSLTNQKTSSSINNKPIYNYIAILEIPDINLKQGLVNKYSKYNSVKYNIQILNGSSMPNITNSNLILAAHSGTSSVSYFKDLFKLNSGSEVYIYYDGTKYTYKINNNYEVSKTGYIDIERDKTINAITLITCKDDDYQLVYIGYLINKETY